MELIKVTTRNDQQVVSARELYFGLGYNQTDYSKWVKRSITENEYFVENEDWVEIGTDAELLKTNKLPPRPSKDYALSLTMAKKLAMMAKTEIGDQYRDYFITCERVSNKNKEYSPKTYLESLKELIEIEEQRLSLSAKH